MMRSTSRRVLLGAALAVVAAGVASAAPSSTGSATAADDPVHSDFNGDGYEDLAIGVPSEKVSGYLQAGAVHILYGSRNGLTSTNDQFFAQSSPGVPGTPQRRDFFGHALAAGDFTGDGYADLAIGVPGEDIGTNTDEGIVQILHGGPDGLTAIPDPISYADLDDDGVSRCRCRLGAALAAADANKDGVADLAIGAPLLDDGDAVDVGGVVLLFGEDDSGLALLGRSINRGERNGARDELELGFVLAAGDHDGDGYDDIAASAREKEGRPLAGKRGGMVRLYRGTAAGIVKADLILGRRCCTPDSIPPVPPEPDRLGAALAFGDFDGDGRDELAMGAPGTVVDGKASAGAVSVREAPRVVAGRYEPGSTKRFTQAGLGGASPQADDKFGLTLAAGDFDDDGRDDLAIGAPFENFSGATNAGIVHVLYGRSSGLSDSLAVIFHQDKPGIAGGAETGDAFGLALSARRLGKGAGADLAIGIPGEALGTTDAAGAVAVLYGGANRLSSASSQLWSQDSSGIADTASTNDKFGTSLG